ncbi:hypothetical protein Scep_009638 [Stephania cephalantha]|uniref:Uncharacterized protein n=1 Tax=Stephania cephalantha TaxID=152367 RepID=A0AAP0PDC5_9MAGN
MSEESRRTAQRKSLIFSFPGLLLLDEPTPTRRASKEIGARRLEIDSAQRDGVRRAAQRGGGLCEGADGQQQKWTKRWCSCGEDDEWRHGPPSSGGDELAGRTPTRTTTVAQTASRQRAIKRTTATARQ